MSINVRRLATILFVALLFAAALSLAPSPANAGGALKFCVCHVPPSENRTIEVDHAGQLNGHFNHGDCCIACSKCVTQDTCSVSDCTSCTACDGF